MKNEPYTIDTILGKATIYSGKPVDKTNLLEARVAELEAAMRCMLGVGGLQTWSEEGMLAVLNRTPAETLVEATNDT